MQVNGSQKNKKKIADSNELRNQMENVRMSASFY